ncbi:MAG: phosphotransferase, partial [Muribaculaceae bacterium]|nr:phosphotransferase [Muribaculaceae bacterium]
MQRLEALVGGADRVISVEKIAGSGSNRRYYRLHLTDGTTVIGVIGTCVAENESFIYLSEYFANRSLPVPRVIAVSTDREAYIQEDLGSTSLYDCLDNTELIGAAIDMLPRFQIHGAIGLDFERCYPVPEMDRRSVMWDLNYFKYCFLKPQCTEIDEPRLEKEFERMSDALLSARPLGFMVRDFQSRNVMIRDGQPYLIDFQGGRRGPVHYDVASFLWQARARFSPSLREQMVERYITASGVDGERFRAELPLFVVFRMLQV